MTNAVVLQNPLFLLMLGFCLAMAAVVVILVLSRASQYPPPGYAPPPMVYPSGGPGDRLNPGCLLLPLLVVGVTVLLALLS